MDVEKFNALLAQSAGELQHLKETDPRKYLELLKVLTAFVDELQAIPA